MKRLDQTISSKPFMIRAMYEWIVENGYKPYMVVIEGYRKAEIPEWCFKSGRVTFNIAPSATNGTLEMGNNFITFSATFDGLCSDIVVPVESVVAVFAEETKEGMQFDAGEESKIPHLTLVQ